MNSIVSAASMIGPITSRTLLITAAAHANSGARRHARPGARIRRRVTVMLIAQQTKPRQARPVPAIHASVPLLGVKTRSESGGSPIEPVSGAL